MDEHTPNAQPNSHGEQGSHHSSHSGSHSGSHHSSHHHSSHHHHHRHHRSGPMPPYGTGMPPRGPMAPGTDPRRALGADMPARRPSRPPGSSSGKRSPVAPPLINQSKNLVRVENDIVRTNSSEAVLKRSSKTYILRLVITSALMVVIATVMHIFQFRPPLFPAFLRMDFSVVFELFAAVAYGPIVGIIVALLKTILYVLFRGQMVLPSAVTVFLVDTVFILITCTYYAKLKFTPNAIRKNYYKTYTYSNDIPRRIIIGGLLGTVCGSVVSYISNVYYAFPMVFEKYGKFGYTEEFYLGYYNIAVESFNSHMARILPVKIPELTSFSQGVLLYNVPSSVVRLIVAAVVCAIVLPPLSDFLYCRVRVEEEFDDTIQT